MPFTLCGRVILFNSGLTLHKGTTLTLVVTVRVFSLKLKVAQTTRHSPGLVR